MLCLYPTFQCFDTGFTYCTEVTLASIFTRLTTILNDSVINAFVKLPLHRATLRASKFTFSYCRRSINERFCGCPRTKCQNRYVHRLIVTPVSSTWKDPLDAALEILCKRFTLRFVFYRKCKRFCLFMF